MSGPEQRPANKEIKPKNEDSLNIMEKVLWHIGPYRRFSLKRSERQAKASLRRLIESLELQTKQANQQPPTESITSEER